jgi:hypothetical protein
MVDAVIRALGMVWATNWATGFGTGVASIA